HKYVQDSAPTRRAYEHEYITPEEVEALQKAHDDAKAAKEAAEEAVAKVPAGSDKDGFEERLEALDNIEVPEATDAEGYAELVADAEAAVAEAEAADQAAQDALDAANEDDYITPEEVEALQKAHDDAKAAKEAAEEAVAKVPAGSDKDGFEERLEALDNIEVPEATDADRKSVV